MRGWAIIIGGLLVGGCAAQEPVVGTGRTVTAKIDRQDRSANATQRAVVRAFHASFTAIDECVYAAKTRMKIEHERRLVGKVSFELRLDGDQRRPKSVHVSLPPEYAAREVLRNCLREAAAIAPYPSNDGGPIVAALETELDVGAR